MSPFSNNIQNNHQQHQLLNTTPTSYIVGATKTPPKTTMAKNTKQHRNNTSPQQTRPPDPQVVEQSPSAHDKARERNQKHIQNKEKTPIPLLNIYSHRHHLLTSNQKKVIYTSTILQSKMNHKVFCLIRKDGNTQPIDTQRAQLLQNCTGKKPN